MAQSPIAHADDEVAAGQQCDLIIIGAGIYGIQAARTYLELHPTAKVNILEASSSIGGVWSHERIYDAFWTQTPLGILGFSDQPMHDVPKEECYYGFFKAKHVSTYLKRYCEDHVYDGSSLGSRVQMQTKVGSVKKDEGEWHVQCNDGEISFRSRHLFDASGLTSTPNWPSLPSQSEFRGMIIHHKEFASFERRLAASPEKKRSIAVLGGAKSAADVAYSCAKAGMDVTWIIRRSGSGPAALVSAKGKAGYANSNELSYTRMTSLFLASIFSPAMGYHWLSHWLNRSMAGRWLVKKLWQQTQDEAVEEADYDREDGKANGFANLRPDTDLFWQNDSTGVNQRKDFFDVIAQKVKVVREDISHLDSTGLVLHDTDRSHVDADIIVCATGWKLDHPYYSEESAVAFGLPVRNHLLDPSTKTRWLKLEQDAEADVLRRFPILDSEWAYRQSAYPRYTETVETPFRLWKSMVPPSDSSLVFLGKLMLGNHFRDAEVQALFACAVLDGNARLPVKPEMEQDIARTTVWCRRRYLRKGLSGNWFYWDTIPYHDSLLAHIGLSAHRGKSWMQDLFRPGFSEDLQGLLPEYRGKYY
ncbi:hypothetical protein B0A50_00924 [Salinomyces thailandicus]|uniref:Uncharacterized protein n=1 Tax=Salinomyces thailandicus TaxID=706561 RepID=A0A4U0UCX8_9PEZI|nr:hypothetical protein B0A50_00924 [Salinomyces thailandica]